MAEQGLTKQPTSQELAVPDFMREDMNAGKADIDLSSIRFPRLGIAQGLSPEMTPGRSQYIEGLRMFDMFNSLTAEVYGKGPLKFIPLQHHVTRIEFDPNDRNKVLDRDVPGGDVRLQWTKDGTGKSLPPKATTFTEVGAILLHDDGRDPEPIIISIKMTNKWQVKAAERVTMFMTSTPGPIFGSIKTVESGNESNDKGTFGVFIIKNLRMLGKGVEGDALDQDRLLYLLAKKYFTQIQGKVIDVDREGGDDTTEFDPAKLEAEAAARNHYPGQPSTEDM